VTFTKVLTIYLRFTPFIVLHHPFPLLEVSTGLIAPFLHISHCTSTISCLIYYKSQQYKHVNGIEKKILTKASFFSQSTTEGSLIERSF
jgi:hypothetical protein